MSFNRFKFGKSALPSSNMNTRWKAEKGKYRVSFIAMTGIDKGQLDFSDSSEIDAPYCNRLYIPNVGYIRDQGSAFRNQILNSGYVTDAKIRETLEKGGKDYYSTTIVLWPVNLTTGKVDANRLKSGDFEVKNFIIGKRKMEQLVALHDEYPLHQFDVKIDSVGDQFKNMTFSPCRDSILIKLSQENEDLFNRVVSMAQTVYERVTEDLARDYPAEKVIEKLGGGSEDNLSLGSSNSNFGSSDDDLDLDNVLDDVLGDD